MYAGVLDLLLLFLCDLCALCGENFWSFRSVSLLQVFFPAAGLQLFQDPPHVLGAVARADEEGVARLDDDRVFHADQGDQLLLGAHQAARAVEEKGLAPRRPGAQDPGVALLVRGKDLAEGRPAAHVIPAEISP